MLSLRDPLKVVVIKGIGSGVGALIIAIALNTVNFNIQYILLALALGFAAYGLSLFFYISAQRHLGAARTSAYYAAAPFIGSLISILLLKESLQYSS
jgi:drug/metabolite transporter (DMT)-like permease